MCKRSVYINNVLDKIIIDDITAIVIEYIKPCDWCYDGTTLFYNMPRNRFYAHPYWKKSCCVQCLSQFNDKTEETQYVSINKNSFYDYNMDAIQDIIKKEINKQRCVVVIAREIYILKSIQKMISSIVIHSEMNNYDRSLNMKAFNDGASDVMIITRDCVDGITLKRDRIISRIVII